MRTLEEIIGIHQYGEGTKQTKVYYELFNHQRLRSQKVFVLLHGFLASSFSYRFLIPQLAKEHTVLVVDIPPFGKSGKEVRFTYSYQQMAEVIGSLLQKLELRNIVLVGHSMGGQIALYTTKAFPHLIHKQVLIGSSGYLGKASPSLVGMSYMPFFSYFFRYQLQEKGMEQTLKKIVFDESVVDQTMVKGYEEPFEGNDIFYALTKMVREREGDMSSKQLQTIQTPTLLICGKEDQVVPIKIGRKLGKQLPNSIFISYPNIGHMIPEEHPRQLSSDILHFSKQYHKF